LSNTPITLSETHAHVFPRFARLDATGGFICGLVFAPEIRGFLERYPNITIELG